MRRKSSSPFNKLTSDASRSSTKSSKVSESGCTIKFFFCHYHPINNKSQQNLENNFKYKKTKNCLDIKKGL